MNLHRRGALSGSLNLILCVALFLAKLDLVQPQQADHEQLPPQTAKAVDQQQQQPNTKSTNVKSKHEFFSLIDSNHDGVINESEYEAGISNLYGLLSKKATSSSSSLTSSFSNDSIKEKLSHLSSSDDLSFLSAFFNSVAMILATEIGDKTFFIAAILSMKHDRLVIFAGSILALICMTILSSMMGMVLPSLLPRQYTHIIGGILFLYFGSRLLLDARAMKGDKCSDELEEVEHELLDTSNKKNEEDIESNINTTAQSSIKSALIDNEKIFMQALTLTFLAEWGDRSQIATIALAAAKDPLGVNVGAILGHSICTGMAVIGGRILATSISEKTISIFGGVIFWIFGLHSLLFEDVS